MNQCQMLRNSINPIIIMPNFPLLTHTITNKQTNKKGLLGENMGLDTAGTLPQN